MCIHVQELPIQCSSLPGGCFRRALKAVFMLVPLFGLQLFLTIYRPELTPQGNQIYENINFIINGSQVGPRTSSCQNIANMNRRYSVFIWVIVK